MIALRVTVALLLLAASSPTGAETRDEYCAGFRHPAPDRAVIRVRTAEQLDRAAHDARPGTTILLEPGEYALLRPLALAVPDLTMRGASGRAADVVLRGRGMTGDAIGVAVAVSAPRVTIADVTIRDVGYHAIQVRGESGATQFTLHHARLLDAGQQLLKVSVSDNGRSADAGVVACSEVGYTDHAPSNYTNGIDILRAKGWVVRANRLFRIRGPESDGWRAGPAILAWMAASDTRVEGNLIIDSFRGVAFGLGPRTVSTQSTDQPFDHVGGVIRNNVIVNLHSWADEAIEVNAGRDARIEHNSVMVGGAIPWSIGVRFPIASAIVRNNLSNRPLRLRDGAAADQQGGIDRAQLDWFANAAAGDLRLTDAGRAVVGAGVPDTDVKDDFDGVARQSVRPDVGAFEYRPIVASSNVR